MLLVQGPLFKNLRRRQGAAMSLGDKKGVGMAGRMRRTALRTAPWGAARGGSPSLQSLPWLSTLSRPPKLPFGNKHCFREPL